MERIIPWMPTLISAATAIIVLGIGGWLTRLGPWYESLNKPSWQPPGWAFAPAWTSIFTLGVIAAVLAWSGAVDDGLKTRVIALFAVNLVLNIAWSAVFFRVERPDWAFIELIFLWLSVLALVIGLWPINSTAGLLLLPYLIWVSFAGYLNLTIVRLNPQISAQTLVPGSDRLAE